MQRIIGAITAVTVILGLPPNLAHAGATLQAEYLFNNTLTSDVAGAPDLVAVNPQGQSGFVTSLVFGNSQIVYNFQSASNAPSQQAGLTLNTNGLVTSNSYSVQMIFSLSGRDGAWRRLVDSLNRTSDAGFYFDPGNQLDVFPITAGGPRYTTGTYDNIALTVAADGTVTGYLDGTQEFQAITNVMNISSDLTLGFFLDNLVGGGQGEWSPGDIAALRVYDGVLSKDQVTALDNVVTSAVPEPAAFALFAGALAGLAALRRRKQMPASFPAPRA